MAGTVLGHELNINGFSSIDCRQKPTVVSGEVESGGTIDAGVNTALDIAFALTHQEVIGGSNRINNWNNVVCDHTNGNGAVIASAEKVETAANVMAGLFHERGNFRGPTVISAMDGETLRFAHDQIDPYWGLSYLYTTNLLRSLISQVDAEHAKEFSADLEHLEAMNLTSLATRYKTRKAVHNVLERTLAAISPIHIPAEACLVIDLMNVDDPEIIGMLIYQLWDLFEGSHIKPFLFTKPGLAREMQQNGGPKIFARNGGRSWYYELDEY